MSGSVVLVLLIGVVAVNSGGKSAEEGKPTSDQTVAPGGGHVPGSVEPEDPTDRQADDDADALGVLGVQASAPGIAVGVPATEPAVAPVAPGRAAAPTLAQGAPGQTVGMGVDSAKPERDEPRIDSAPESSDHPAPASRSLDGEKSGLPLLAAPGAHFVTVSVDETEVIRRTRASEDGRAAVVSPDGTTGRSADARDPLAGEVLAGPTPEADTVVGGRMSGPSNAQTTDARTQPEPSVTAKQTKRSRSQSAPTETATPVPVRTRSVQTQPVRDRSEQTQPERDRSVQTQAVRDRPRSERGSWVSRPPAHPGSAP